MPERAAGRIERIVPRLTGREHGAGAVGGAPQRAEHVTGLAVDANAAHTVDGDAEVEEELRFLRQTLADTAP